MTYSLSQRKKIKKLIKIGILLTIFLFFYLIGQRAIKVYFLPKNTSPAALIVDFRKETSQQLKQYGLSSQSIIVQPDMIRLIIGKGTTVLLSKSKDIGQQIQTLQAIINRDRIEGKKAKSIDLRSKNPVVRY